MASIITKMADLAFTDEEKAKREAEYSAPTIALGPKYPYGMTLCLSERELDLAGLGGDDIEVGTTLHMFVLGEVTSVSVNDSPEGKKKRVEVQLTHIAGEDEDDENDAEDAEEDGERQSLKDKWYGSK